MVCPIPQGDHNQQTMFSCLARENGEESGRLTAPAVHPRQRVAVVLVAVDDVGGAYQQQVDTHDEVSRCVDRRQKHTTNVALDKQNTATTATTTTTRNVGQCPT